MLVFWTLSVVSYIVPTGFFFDYPKRLLLASFCTAAMRTQLDFHSIRDFLEVVSCMLPLEN